MLVVSTVYDTLATRDTGARPRMSRENVAHPPGFCPMKENLLPECAIGEEKTIFTRTQETLKAGLAERVGFEPTCRLPDKTLSRRPRYDHFGTSPGRVQADLTVPPLRSVVCTTGHVR